MQTKNFTKEKNENIITFKFHLVIIAVEMFLTQKNLIILMQFTIRKESFAM